MKQLLTIIYVELYQIRQDKRVLIAFTIYMCILLSALLGYISTTPDTIEGIHSSIILMVVLSVISFSLSSLIATDITTGEKERKTLEALLMTNCSRHIIYWAKWLLSYIFSVIPVVIGILLLLIYKAFASNTPLTYTNILLVFMVLFPFTALITSVLVLKGFLAKTMRSSKSLDLVLFICLPFVSVLFIFITVLPLMIGYYVVVGVIIFWVSRAGVKYLHSEEII